jgi:hypothetical protein
LALRFGDFSQSEKLSEIKPPLEVLPAPQGGSFVLCLSYGVCINMRHTVNELFKVTRGYKNVSMTSVEQLSIAEFRDE